MATLLDPVPAVEDFASTEADIFAAMEPHDGGDFANNTTPLVRNCWYVAARAYYNDLWLKERGLDRDLGRADYDRLFA